MMCRNMLACDNHGTTAIQILFGVALTLFALAISPLVRPHELPAMRETTGTITYAGGCMSSELENYQHVEYVYPVEGGNMIGDGIKSGCHNRVGKSITVTYEVARPGFSRIGDKAHVKANIQLEGWMFTGLIGVLGVALIGFGITDLQKERY